MIAIIIMIMVMIIMIMMIMIIIIIFIIIIVIIVGVFWLCYSISMTKLVNTITLSISSCQLGRAGYFCSEWWFEN